MSRISLIFIVTLCCLLVFDNGFSQERYTEAEVQQEDLFIQATRERLLGRLDKAESILKQVIKTDRQNDVAYYELARIYRERENVDEAISNLNKALRIQPDNEWYLLMKGDVLQENKRFEAASVVFEQLSEKFTEADIYQLRWAYNLRMAGNAEAAIEVYNGLESKRGVSEDLSRRKFDIYSFQNKQNEALNELIKLSNAFPENTAYLFNLAGFHNQLGNTDEARKLYTRILEIDPNHPEANMAVAGDLYNPSDEAAYLKSIRPLIINQQIDIDTKIKELLPYVQKHAENSDGGLGDALLLLAEDLQNTHPENAKAYAIYGDVLMNAGNISKAVSRYEKTLQLDDSKVAVWEQYLYGLDMENQFGKMKAASEEMLEIFPNQAIAYYFNGIALTQLGDIDAALDVLQEGLFIGSRNPFMKSKIQLSIAKAEMARSNWDLALDQIEASLDSSNNQNYEALELWGDLLFLTGNVDDAIEKWNLSKKSGNPSLKLLQKIQEKQFIK